MIYFINHIILLLEALVCRFGLKNNKRLFCILSFGQLFLILALRGEGVGTDTAEYIRLFKNLIAGGNTYLEIGNTLLVKICTIFSNKVQFVLMIYAFFTILGMYMYIKEMSSDIYISIIIYESMMYYFFSFNCMRQALAVSLIALSVVNLQKERYWRALVFTMVATSIHASAIIFFSIWVLAKCKIIYSKNRFLGSVVLAIAWGGLGKYVFILIEKLIKNNRFFSRYAYYIGSSFINRGNWLHPLLFLAILCLCCFLLYGIFEEKRNHYNIMLWSLTIGVWLYFISLEIRLVNRSTYYFTFVIISLLPNLISQIKRKRIRYQWKASLIVFVTIYNFWMIYQNAQGIRPYDFYWNNWL